MPQLVIADAERHHRATHPEGAEPSEVPGEISPRVSARLPVRASRIERAAKALVDTSPRGRPVEVDFELFNDLASFFYAVPNSEPADTPQGDSPPGYELERLRAQLTAWHKWASGYAGAQCGNDRLIANVDVRVAELEEAEQECEQLRARVAELESAVRSVVDGFTSSEGECMVCCERPCAAKCAVGKCRRALTDGWHPVLEGGE